MIMFQTYFTIIAGGSLPRKTGMPFPRFPPQYTLDLSFEVSGKKYKSSGDLGFIIASQLSLPSAHIIALCRSGYYQLRQMRPDIRSLTADAAKTLVQAFILCCLDYCNSLLSNYLMQKVQSVQNAAARLITGTWRCERTTPVLQKFHWLPSCSSKGGVQACVPGPPVVG